MTVEEARERYGVKTDNPYGRKVGYVLCGHCPLDGKSICPGKRSGYGDAWEAIANYMTEREGDEPKKPKPKSPRRLKNEGNPVEHPDHYNQGEIECIDAMIAAFGKEKVCDWCVMTSFKYHWRYQHKNGDEDICKASWYIDKYKELKELCE